ncbi:hypothetical protein RRG08_061033 [Elysia crispata]|uniref:Uncharacterized protein n=1 Tax=Elysia crispata TaxID=231223 RepID=A0AAE1AV67_9GAST|nr:hypothetical protein RRG08_061033 [Elysia crispata]
MLVFKSMLVRISTWSAVLILTVTLFASTTESIWLGPVGIEAQDFARCSGPGETFSSLRLEHAGDVWTLSCRPAPSDAHLADCYWSNFQNNYTDNLDFSCRENYVITELEKLYDQTDQDFRLNFKCCKDADLITDSCTLTRVMFYKSIQAKLDIPADSVLAGWYSQYYDGLGRSHQYKLCKLKPRN